VFRRARTAIGLQRHTKHSAVAHRHETTAGSARPEKHLGRTRPQYDSAGRRIVHHEKFFARERRFHWFKRAKTWEQENLARFLQ